MSDFPEFIYAMLIDAGKATANKNVKRLKELREEAKNRDDNEAWNQIDNLIFDQRWLIITLQERTMDIKLPTAAELDAEVKKLCSFLGFVNCCLKLTKNYV